MFAISHLLHKNMIMKWPLAIAAIPSGWTECNGLLGTPDLRAKFIVGACPACPVGTIGGDITHTHNFSAGSHSHTIDSDVPDIALGDDYNSYTADTLVSGITQTGSSLPPFYSLVYIMKL